MLITYLFYNLRILVAACLGCNIPDYFEGHDNGYKVCFDVNMDIAQSCELQERDTCIQGIRLLDLSRPSALEFLFAFCTFHPAPHRE